MGWGEIKQQLSERLFIHDCSVTATINEKLQCEVWWSLLIFSMLVKGVAVMHKHGSLCHTTFSLSDTGKSRFFKIKGHVSGHIEIIGSGTTLLFHGVFTEEL